MAEHHETSAAAGRFNDLNGRTIAAVAIGVAVLLFIVLNRHQTHVSFILFSTGAPLWLVLAFVAAGGFVAGLLFGRKRYQPRRVVRTGTDAADS
jgi:uncharacterized integral membrane protein